MKKSILTAVILSGLISTSVFAARHTANEAPVDKPGVKSSKSLVDAKANLRGIGGMEATKSDRPAVKSGKSLATTKSDLRGFGGMEATKSDKPVVKSGKSLAKAKSDLRGMGGMEGDK